MSNDYNGPDPQQGFGFQPGQLIPQAPYIFPGEQELFMLLELTASYAGGWVAVVAEIILLILELIDVLVQLFTGKPREQDTLTVAGRLGRGKSPIAHLMSVQIHRNLSQNDIVLSDSDPSAQKILAEIRKQAETSLTTLGTPAARAQQVVDQVWTNTQSATEQLPTELNQPIPPGYVLVGPMQVQQDYITQYNLWIQKGKDPLQAAKHATNWIYNNSHMADLNLIQVRVQPPPIVCPPGTFLEPTTGTCKPIKTVQVCPPGTVWDPGTETCVSTTQPPPPGACIPVIDGTGDTLTDGLNCVSQNLNVIQQQLAELQLAITGGTSNTDPVTCSQLSGFVGTLSEALSAIASVIGTSTGVAQPPIDITPIIKALQIIGDALMELVKLQSTIWNQPVKFAPLAPDLTGQIDLALSTYAEISPFVAAYVKPFLPQS